MKSKTSPDTEIGTDLTQQFLSAFRHHPSGVAVITADSGDGPVAFTASSVSSFSAEPPMILFSASARSSSTPAIKNAETVVVHLLAESDQHLGQLCATSGVDRFADVTLWDRLETGEPRFHSAATWMRCRIAEVREVSGSLVVLVEVLEAGGRNTSGETAGNDRPLVYHARAWHALDALTQVSP